MSNSYTPTRPDSWFDATYTRPGASSATASGSNTCPWFCGLVSTGRQCASASSRASSVSVRSRLTLHPSSTRPSRVANQSLMRPCCGTTVAVMPVLTSTRTTSGCACRSLITDGEAGVRAVRSNFGNCSSRWSGSSGSSLMTRSCTCGSKSAFSACTSSTTWPPSRSRPMRRVSMLRRSAWRPETTRTEITRRWSDFHSSHLSSPSPVGTARGRSWLCRSWITSAVWPSSAPM